MDDKANIPVGEPACADVATCHMNKSLTKSKVNLESTDYNYHCGNITPSVNLVCNIPESASESFYSEQIYVGLKSSVFQASEPVQHAIELIHVLRSELKSKIPPYLVLFAGGGADHNMTFLTNVHC